MAILKLTALVSSIKGKVAGTVFQSSPQGQVMRPKKTAKSQVTTYSFMYYFHKSSIFTRMANNHTSVAVCEAIDNPTILGSVFSDGTRNANVTLPSQQTIISQLATQWRNLDPAAQDSWLTGAVNYPFKNKHGDTYTGSGYQVYQAVNASRLQIFLDPLDFCPTPAAIVAPTILQDWSNQFNEQTMLTSFPDGIPDGTYVQVYATPPKSAGRNSALNQALIATFLPQAAFDVPLLFCYLQKFGVPPANAKLKTVFGGKGQVNTSQMIITGTNNVLSTSFSEPKASICANDRIKVLNGFNSTIDLGNLPALSNPLKKFNLYGTQLGDPWTLTKGGADASAVQFTFNGVLETAGVIAGGCDAYGNLTGFVLEADINTGAIGGHTVTLTLACAAISFSQTCTITWFSV